MKSSVVVIGGGNGSTNLGDEAMWEAGAGVVREVLPDVRIVTDSVSGWSPSLRGVETLPYISFALRRGGRLPELVRVNGFGETLERIVSRPGRDRFARTAAEDQAGSPSGSIARSWFDAIQASRGIVFCGAGGINDQYASHAVFGWALLVEWARQARRPVAFVGQGVGPLRNADARRVAAQMFSQAELVTVRDRESMAVVKDLLGDDAPVALTADWACLVEPSRDDRERARAYRKTVLGDSAFLAVSLHRRPGTSRREWGELSMCLHEAVVSARSHGMRALVVPTMRGHVGADDASTARSLMRGWPVELRESVVILEPGTIGFVRAVLGLAEGAVATRYHALVFALSEGVPTLGISHDAYYTQKLSGASALFGVDGNVVPLGESRSRLASSLMELAEGRWVPTTRIDLEAIKQPLFQVLENWRQ